MNFAQRVAAPILALAVLAAAVAASDASADPLRIEDVIGNDEFEEARLSPTGEYLAVTVPLGDRTALATFRLADGQRLGSVHHGRDVHIADFEWAGPERLIYSIGQRFGELKAPQSTGELFAVDADGKHNELLIGYRAGNDRPLSTHINPRSAEPVFARLVDPLPDDPKFALISSYMITGSEMSHTRVERMDIRSGRRKVVARAPVPNARFFTDHAHQVRFALGEGSDNFDKLYYRERDGSDWQLLNDEVTSGRRMFVLGFSTDNLIAYLQVEEDTGPDALYTFDAGSGSLALAARDDDCDIHQLLLSPFDRSPYGAMFMDGKPRMDYFQPEGELARLHRSLQAGFPDQVVTLGQASADGGLGLLTVHSDRNPGDLYLFDFRVRKAQYLFARNQGIDPERLSGMRPISLSGRDGLPLHGYLTVPAGSTGKGLPMVVYPHGGPIGIQDEWRFEPTVQLLASRGYAVLQLNFRGSGGYGRAFLQAGYRQWGRAMQDDLTDATRWAVAEGIADPERICIYGASYGGYAALMGAAKEPDLYRCAAGHVGVYDLDLIYTTGDSAGLGWAQTHYETVLGREDLPAVSPNRLASRIKAPVLLTAGSEDGVAPAIHTERMRDALTQAGIPVQAKIYPGEGHGFFISGNRVDHYQRLLAFLDQHLGGQVMGASATAVLHAADD